MSLRESLDTAEINAKAREFNRDKDLTQTERRKNLVEELKELYGEDFYIGQKRKQNSRVSFAQLIQHNIQFLIEVGYLTKNEESFLFRISSFLDFKTNIIVKKDFKNSQSKDSQELPDVAGPSYLSDLMGVHRTSMSRLMNGLKNKGILGTAETGTRTEDGRFCTSRTWFVNPNIMYCGDKSDIDKTVQMIFRESLINIRDQKGKKRKLPVNLFI